MDTSMNRKSADNIFSALDKIYLAYIAYFNKSKKKQGIPTFRMLNTFEPWKMCQYLHNT